MCSLPATFGQAIAVSLAGRQRQERHRRRPADADAMLVEKSKEDAGMKPGTVWIAIVLLALGVCGILDAGVVPSETIG
jgi:hypothetical protein